MDYDGYAAGAMQEDARKYLGDLPISWHSTAKDAPWLAVSCQYSGAAATGRKGLLKGRIKIQGEVLTVD